MDKAEVRERLSDLNDELDELLQLLGVNETEFRLSPSEEHGGGSTTGMFDTASDDLLEKDAGNPEHTLPEQIIRDEDYAHNRKNREPKGVIERIAEKLKKLAGRGDAGNE